MSNQEYRISKSNRISLIHDSILSIYKNHDFSSLPSLRAFRPNLHILPHRLFISINLRSAGGHWIEFKQGTPDSRERVWTTLSEYWGSEKMAATRYSLGPLIRWAISLGEGSLPEWVSITSTLSNLYPGPDRRRYREKPNFFYF